MKKILLIIILVIIGGLIWVRVGKAPENTLEEGYSLYQSRTSGLSFEYPDFLTLNSGTTTPILHHDIPYRNTGGCDMMGEEEIYERLTDFSVKFEIYSLGMVETMKVLSPYIPEENFVQGKVVESPGFIDKVNFGDLEGFAIYEGAEGCGHVRYYLEIDGNKTLVVTKESIQALSGVRGAEVEAEILAVPGAISRQKSDEIFKKIMESVEI